MSHGSTTLSAANGITSWSLRQSLVYWMWARMIAKHHEDRWTKLVSNWNQAERLPQKVRPAKRWEDDLNTCLQPNRKTTTTTAEDCAKWDAMESDNISSRLKQPARPTTPITTTTTTQPTTHDHTTGTTETHDQYEDDTKDDDEQDDDDTLFVFSQVIGSWTSTTSKQPHQAHSLKQRNQVSHDICMLSAPHLLADTDARPLCSKRQEI